MNFDQIFDSFNDKNFIVFLQETDFVVNYNNKQITEMLNYLYKSDEMIKQRLGSILNAIFTQKLQTFMISKRKLVTLFKNDKNTSYKNIGTKDYKVFLAKITNSGMFEVLRKPGPKQAGVYKLINKDIVNLLTTLVGEKILEKQEKYILNYYDSFYNKKGIKYSENLTEEQRKQRREKAREIRKREINKIQARKYL